ncbi:MAG: hypothetical protein WAO08_22110 [Hyphomicrobiaceae bacterium]
MQGAQGWRKSAMTGMHVYAALPAAPISIPYASKVIAGVAGAEHKSTQQIAAIFTRMTANPAVRPGMRALKVPHVDLASGDSIWSRHGAGKSEPAARTCHPSLGTPQPASRRIWWSRRTRRAWIAISAGPSNRGMGIIASAGVPTPCNFVFAGASNSCNR